MSFLLHSPPPEINIIRPTSRFTEQISSPQIPRLTTIPTQTYPIHNLECLPDSETSDSYLEMSLLDDFIPKLEDVIELISKTTERGLALTAEGYPFYRMLLECSRADDTASGADTAMHTSVRRGFFFVRRDMVKRRRCLVGGRGLWLVRPRQGPLPKKLSRVAYEQKQSIWNRVSKKTPDITYEQKREIARLVNTLPEREMEIALNIVRRGMLNPKDVVDDELEMDIDELPNEVLYSLLRFVRMHAPRVEGFSPAQSADAADSAALIAPTFTPRLRKSA